MERMVEAVMVEGSNYYAGRKRKERTGIKCEAGKSDHHDKYK